MPETQDQVITLFVEGGVIHDVTGIPAGVRLRVLDADYAGYDAPDRLVEVGGQTYYEVVFTHEVRS
jgi:hypothetical protein